MEPVGLEEEKTNNSSAAISSTVTMNGGTDPQQTAPLHLAPLLWTEATASETALLMKDQAEAPSNGHQLQDQQPQPELESQEPDTLMTTVAVAAAVAVASPSVMEEAPAPTNYQESSLQEPLRANEAANNGQVDTTPVDELQPDELQGDDDSFLASPDVDELAMDDHAPPAPMNYQEHEPQVSSESMEPAFDDHIRQSVAAPPAELLEQPAEGSAFPEQAAAPNAVDPASMEIFSADSNQQQPLNPELPEPSEAMEPAFGDNISPAAPPAELLDQPAGASAYEMATDPLMKPFNSKFATQQGRMHVEPLAASGGIAAPQGEFSDIFGSSDFGNAPNMGQELLEIMSTGSDEQHHQQGGMQPSNGDVMNMDPIPAGVMAPPQQQQFAPGGALPHDGVIELLDDEDESAAALSSKKRKWPEDNGSGPLSAGAAAQASAESRAQHMPSWMRDSRQFHLGQTSLAAPPRNYPSYAQNMAQLPTAASIVHQHHSYESMLLPVDVPMKPGYLPTWKRLLPREFLAARKLKEQMATQRKAYALSVLNVSEFTVAGVSPDGYSDPSSVQGLRSRIRQFSREYGKAVFERDSEAQDGGKWRIPLGAYQAFYTFLTQLPRTSVQGIPEAHLNIAMLGRQRLEKGFPSVEKLIHIGVPKRMANTLAPFQRGGVDFVHERKGRALIADEMGLGKTIQAIASMAIYHEEWPVLVLSPSGARYHWQNEFMNWLGEENTDQKLLDFGKEGEAEENDGLPHDHADFRGEEKPPMSPLLESQVHVLTSGNDPILPSPDTKVVIVSYGLAPKLALEGKMLPGLFKCAIVDESHMLKNKNSKRTKGLMPVLSATNRCILLSGTPAFARPIELWPQVKILGSSEDKSLSTEEEFVKKYVKGRSRSRLAELHTLLIGTLMIRRMKADILKQLPSKVREQALVNVLDDESREEFQGYLEALRRGKGAMANIARNHEATTKDEEIAQDIASTPKLSMHQVRSSGELKKQVEEEIQAHFNEKTREITEFYAAQLQLNPQVDPNLIQMAKLQQLNGLRTEIDKFYHTRLTELKKENVAPGAKPAAAATGDNGDEPKSRKAALIQMYKKTGQMKIPLVADMLKLWIANPTKGKLCIFAHHISVLNEIGSRAGLSNADGSPSKYIRIDGSTNPKQRQEQINAFQKDPTVRIALLGITAAGVAVTLTASSTVWFAELFWTPALLIQAEDRCHRIGQQARVRCLYVVAKGTLDEILWKHVEKKFRDLGEFVEGKEKMKLVVHKRYKGSVELRKSLETDKEEEFDDEDDTDVDAMESAEQLENELHDDIEELEREEQEMLKADATSDDDEDAEGKPAAGQTVAGSTETEAICLSDDEDEEEAVPIRRSLQEEGVKNNREFPELKLYKMRFPAPSCGIEIALFKGRVVVKGKSLKVHRADSKPHVGDILISCNNEEVVTNVKLKALMQHFQDILGNEGSIEFIFGEDPEFADYFKSRLAASDFAMDSYMDEEGGIQGDPNNFLARLSSLPRYHLTFEGDSDLGFGIESINSVIIVTTIHPSRLEALGPASQPQVGDAILAINKAGLRPGLSTGSIKKILAALKAKGTVHISFGSADASMKATIAARLQQAHGQPLPAVSSGPLSAPSLRQISSGEPEVIDLLD